MWHLRSFRSLDVIYYLPCDGQYVIGRKDCPIVISDDQSISRRHAILTIKANEVILQDQSKFGTEVNKLKLTSSVPQTLHHNDIIRFGQGTSSFRLLHQPLVFCCSNMSGDLKLKVQEYANKLGGKMVSNWSSSCTHLVMTGVTITVKVVNALSTCCPIVSLQWLEDSVKYKSEAKPLPLTNGYIPALVDTNLLKGGSCPDNVSLKPLHERRKLFAGKSICFLCETQYSNLKYSLKSGGGTVHLLTTPTNELTHDTSIVIDPVDKRHPLLNTVKSMLHNANMRLVSESEIGYAVLYCSIQHYCNPKVSIGYSQIPAQLPPPSLSCSLPYTQATQTTDISSILAYNSVMEPSLKKDEQQEEEEEEDIGGVRVVSETIVKPEPNVSLREMNDSVVSQSTANNSTILAPDSFPMSQLSILGRRKRNKNEDKKEEKGASLSLSTKKTKLAKDPLPSDGHLPSLAPPPTTPPKFISTRRPSPHKSPLSLKLKTSSPIVSQLSILQHQDTQENPLPRATPITTPCPRATPTASNLFEGMRSQRTKRVEKKATPVVDTKKTHYEIQKEKEEEFIQYQRSLMVGVFISARKKPSIYQQIPGATDDDQADSLPLPVPVKTVSLVVAKRPVNRSIHNDIPSGTKNFKNFKKVVHPNHIHSSISRLIGGTDLKVYNQ